MTPLNAVSSIKTSLGMGELLVIMQDDEYINTSNEQWAFLEVQPDTEILELEFLPYGSDTPISVTRYNVVNEGVTLIPPVYGGRRGLWVKVKISGGQINVYGIEPIG